MYILLTNSMGNPERFNTDNIVSIAASGDGTRSFIHGVGGGLAFEVKEDLKTIMEKIEEHQKRNSHLKQGV